MNRSKWVSHWTGILIIARNLRAKKIASSKAFYKIRSYSHSMLFTCSHGHRRSSVSLTVHGSDHNLTRPVINLNYIQPKPINHESARFQKGFHLRKFDSVEHFDDILTKGFGEDSNGVRFTLQLTLTPNYIRT